jgi:hypothetical protein
VRAGRGGGRERRGDRDRLRHAVDASDRVRCRDDRSTRVHEVDDLAAAEVDRAGQDDDAVARCDLGHSDVGQLARTVAVGGAVVVKLGAEDGVLHLLLEGRHEGAFRRLRGLHELAGDVEERVRIAHRLCQVGVRGLAGGRQDRVLRTEADGCVAARLQRNAEVVADEVDSLSRGDDAAEVRGVGLGVPEEEHLALVQVVADRTNELGLHRGGK